MAPSTQALLFVHVILPQGAAIPIKLSHDVTARVGAAPAGERDIRETGGETPVDRRNVVVIGPPLRGKRYLAADSPVVMPPAIPGPIDAFVLTGSSPGTAAFDAAEANGTPLAIAPPSPTSSHECHAARPAPDQLRRAMKPSRELWSQPDAHLTAAGTSCGARLTVGKTEDYVVKNARTATIEKLAAARPFAVSLIWTICDHVLANVRECPTDVASEGSCGGCQ